MTLDTRNFGHENGHSVTERCLISTQQSEHTSFLLVIEGRAWSLITHRKIFRPEWYSKCFQTNNLTTLIITYLLLFFYLLTARSRVIFEKLTGSQRVKKIPASCGNRRFITALTSVCHLPQSWARSIQSMPSHNTPWRSILILSSHLHQGIPSGLFPSGLPPTPSSHTCYMPRLSHPSPFNHPNDVWWGARLMNLLIM